MVDPFTIYKGILIFTELLVERRPAKGSPEHELLAGLYPALRKYEDAMKQQFSRGNGST